MKKFFGNVLAVILGNLLTFIFIGLVLGAFAMFSLAEGLFQDNGQKMGLFWKLPSIAQSKKVRWRMNPLFLACARFRSLFQRYHSVHSSCKRR